MTFPPCPSSTTSTSATHRKRAQLGGLAKAATSSDDEAEPAVSEPTIHDQHMRDWRLTNAPRQGSSNRHRMTIGPIKLIR